MHSENCMSSYFSYPKDSYFYLSLFGQLLKRNMGEPSNDTEMILRCM